MHTKHHRAMLTKVRAVLAMGASIMVMISSLYNTTYAFTETIVQDILFEEQMHYLERPDEEADNDVTYFYESPSQETQKESLPPIEDEVSSLLRKVAKKDKKDKAKAIEKPAKEKPSKSKPTQKKESKDSQKKEEIDTTVIVTTNWMPGLPSTTMIDKVLDSLSHLKGLSNDYPLIIAVDGAYEQGGRSQSVRNVDMRAYIKALEKKYNNDRTTIITSSRKIMLVGNMKRALKKVNTEFILVLQHDLPFINDVNHTELIDTLHQYPEEVRLVRFATERILTRKRDSGICSGNIDFKAKKLELTKTHVWSDR
jgi:hypothetical protein